MTDAVQAGIIAAIAPTTLAAVAVYYAVQNHRTTRAVEEKVVEVKAQNDGRFTEILNLLLANIKTSSFRDGEDSKAQELRDGK